MVSFLHLAAFLLPAARLVYSQCNNVALGGFPSPGEIVYIPPTATCTFAEADEANGNCPTYTDTAILIDPTGGQFITTATLPNNALVTVQYPVPGPAGLMPEGVYTLSDFINPPGQGFFAVITLTHEPVIVTTDSTSTIVTSTTDFATTTTTSTIITTSTVTPVPNTATNMITQTTTVPTVTTTSTSTITPKPVTKTHYTFTTVTVTVSCLHFDYDDNPAVIKGRQKGSPHKRSNRRGLKNLEIRHGDDTEHGLEKRAFNPCVPENYANRPTATLYSNTVFTTTTVSFTSTEIDSSSTTSTTFTTLPTGTVTTSTTTTLDITPTKTITKHTRLPRDTTTTTTTITVTRHVKGPGHLTDCDS